MSQEDESKNEARDNKEIKKSMVVRSSGWSTMVFAVAIHDLEEENHLLVIPCEYGSVITTEVQDLVKDCVHVDGVAMFEIGSLPIGYSLGIDDWEQMIPLPSSIIKRYMSKSLRDRFDNWQAMFKDNHRIRFVQFCTVY